jgi:hypothetical protein
MITGKHGEPTANAKRLWQNQLQAGWPRRKLAKANWLADLVIGTPAGVRALVSFEMLPAVAPRLGEARATLKTPVQRNNHDRQS